MIGSLLLLGIAAPVAAQTTTIGFEEYPTCDQADFMPCHFFSNEYASLGIVFVPVSGAPFSQTDVSAPTNWTTYLCGQPNCFGAIEARFVDTSNQSTYVTRGDVRFVADGLNLIGGTTVYWLNKNGLVINSQTNQTGYPVLFETMVAPSPVGGFRIAITCGTQNCEIGGFAIDNIQFGPTVFCLESGDPYCNHDPTNDKDLGCNKNAVGNPCHPGTGNKYQREDDYTSPGLHFSRHYNSGLATVDVGLGFGWTSTFHKSVEKYVDGTVRVRSASGRSEPFRRVSSAWQADADSTSTLVESPSGYTYTRPNKDKETYDFNGRILSETERTGRSLTYAYFPTTGRLERVTDNFGRTLSFTYRADGRVETLVDSEGRLTTYSYDGLGNLVSATDPAVATRYYHYENAAFPHHLTGITDENGARFASWTYDGSGRAKSSEHVGGVEHVDLVYASGTATNVTDALGTTRTYSLQKVLGATKLTGLSQWCTDCGNAASQTFDSRGNLASAVDFQGYRTCYAYDGTRNLEVARVEGFAPTVTSCPANLASYTPAAGTRERKFSTSWHAAFRFPLSVIQADRTTDFTYDANGNLLTRKVTDTKAKPKVSRKWTYTYSSFGQVLTADGPRTDVTDITTTAYYSCSTGMQCGQVQTMTNALNQVTTYDSYNAHGQVTQVTDPNGVVTTLEYDPRQRLIARCVSGTLPTCIAGELTQMEYYPTGLLKKVTNPDASYIENVYDPAHRLTEIRDGLGNRITYTLDNMGNRTVESAYDPTNWLARTRSQVFNSLNQLWKQIGAAGTGAVTTEFLYDARGNLTNTNAPFARNTSQQYDGLGRIERVTDPSFGITLFSHDPNDNLTTVTDPRNLVTSYTYNGFGDVSKQVSPDTGTTTNTFDSGGNLRTSTDSRAAVTTYTYDALDRVRTAAFKVGNTTDQTITFTYDAGINGKGHLTGASDTNHAMSWAYDALGRVTSKSQTVGTVTKTDGYGYTNGNLTSMTTPSGQSVLYGYNSNRQITSITINGTTLLNSVLYDPFGPVRGWTWGNATLAVRTYDADGNVTQIDSAGLKTYAYDDAFRITGITDTVTPANSWTYGYDFLDRITSGVKTGATRGWTYDANGNRLTETGSAASTHTISGTNNRVSSITGALPRTYSYDTTGNVLSYATISTTYNNRGRMKTLTKGAVTATYVYNALGQFVKQSGGPSGTVLYVYDEAGRLLGEYTSTGGLIQETIWMGDTPVATIRPGTPAFIYYVHTDHLDTPRRVSRPSDNQLIWTWYSDPFGTDLPNENPAAGGTFKYNLRFPGQLYDGHAGLNQNYFRDYDPAIGRYVQSDPIGLTGGINTFSYVASNPMSLIDPRGLEILMCSRKAQGWLFEAVDANHGYLWDTRTNKSCGAHGSSGRGMENPIELGPGPGKDNCNAVPRSSGLEDQIMSCCKEKGKEAFVPTISDCQERQRDCVQEAGLISPGTPGGYFGPPCNTCSYPRPPHVPLIRKVSPLMLR
jgi:RHS repeat-associated protein